MKKNNSIQMVKQNLIISCLILVVSIIACKSIKHYQFREQYLSHNELIHISNDSLKKPYLKAHLKNGEVYILDDKWSLDTIQNIISGHGNHYDFTREILQTGVLNIALDSVALFETNAKLKPKGSARMAAMAILTSMDLALGIICLTVPKACFGSCPTFYLDQNSGERLADAEAFSNAISPSLEYSDIDDLMFAIEGDTILGITMKNEALETHIVKKANLSIIRKNKGQEVFLSPDDKYYITSGANRLVGATGPEGDISSSLMALDGIERTSLADANSLVTDEEIFFEFENLNLQADKGIKLSFRQTMMTTYCLYSAIGYMGDEVGDIFAKLETEKESVEKMNSIFYNALGGIKIYVQEDDLSWKYQGEMYETGPIAFNHELLPLKNLKTKHKIKVKLAMNKGLWRLDDVSLLNIVQEAKPMSVLPYSLKKNKKIDTKSLDKITSNNNEYIVSMPGDEYYFSYLIPSCKHYEKYQVFLDTRGYYIEWMRDSWLKEKNLYALKKMMDNPKAWLNEETSNYKIYEAKMEKQFWDSKWTQNNKSYESL